MSSIIEKITLYDFFSYLIPGTVFLSLLCLRVVQEADGSVPTEVTEHQTVLIILFLLWSFLCGMILSELARLISDMVDRFWLKNRYILKIKETANIDISVLKVALRQSGFEGKATVDEDEVKFLKTYLPAIYSSVQADDNYKRIHNYSSSEAMCKNLTISVLLGGLAEILYLFPRVQQGYAFCIIAMWISSVMLLAHRYYRFRIKKYAYALIWFIEKQNISGKKESL